MAGQPGSTVSALPAAAHVVGNAFVNQYYNVLHQSPQVVHRFYTDASRLTRAEAGAEGAVDTVVSQSEIHHKVMGLDYGDFKAEIITVDSQESLRGGVLVMVTGALSSKVSGKRNFVQSFFLAPQEKGYFVLNDIFRYLDEDAQTSNQVPLLSNGVSDSLQVHAVTEKEVSQFLEHEKQMSPPGTPKVEPTVEEIFESLEQVEGSEAGDDLGMEDLGHVGSTPVIDEPTSPMAASLVPVQSLEDSSEEPPKKSYASILRMKENAGSPLPSIMYTTAPRNAALATERAAPYLSNPVILTVIQDTLDDVTPIENEVDGRSVYVKNLPMSISSSQLEEEFGKFGIVKSGGVSVKSQKQGVCYAFVEFEETSAAQTAIELSPISIGGRQVYIEEKRPMGSRVGGRSGRIPGTLKNDRVYRSDGLRGRGSFTGRGPASRGSGQDRENLNRGRGIGPVRNASGNFGGGLNDSGAGSGAVSYTSGDINRRETQAGNVNRNSRRGGSNQIHRNGAISRGSTPVAAV